MAGGEAVPIPTEAWAAAPLATLACPHLGGGGLEPEELAWLRPIIMASIPGRNPMAPEQIRRPDVCVARDIVANPALARQI